MKLKQWPIGALVLAVGSLSLGLTYVRADDDDPPGRAAHLSYSTGSVSFRPASVDDWSAASRNYPLTTGDSLWSDRDSRAELQIGSSIVRLGPETAFSFLNLDDRTAQMRLSEGEVSVRVARLDEDDVVEVDTPNAAVSLLRPGFYRIDVRPDGDETIVTVRNGEADVTSGGASFSVRSRESAYVSGYDSPSYDVREARGRDAWEDWSDDRDRRVERSVSSRYVSREMVGYSDLDEHGSWREGTEYGAVWFPNRVDAGWAPYRHGRWAWVYPWGWTWVDDSPWGFAPFHYGRWAHVGGRWGWCPGTIVARPVYAPALVVFLGGDRWGASLSIGDGVGWLPLGPREVYVPPYAHSQTYIRNVNITQVNVTNVNITNVTRGDATFVNQRVRGAVTAVPRNDFVQARSIAKTAVVVPETAVRSARMASGGQVVGQIKPRRESVVGMNAPRPTKAPPPRAMERPVVVRQTPPAPVKLEEQERPRAERRKANPLVRPAVPETGGAVKLRPARPDAPKAEPVAPRDAQRAPRPKTGPPSAGPDRKERPGEKTPATERQQPGTDVQPPQGARPKADQPPTRPAPRAEPDERRQPRAAPQTPPEERPTRPAPRAEPDERRPPRAAPQTPPEERPTRPAPRVEPEERRPQRAEPDERKPPRAEPEERKPQKAEPDERRPPRAAPDERRPPRAEPEERKPQKAEPDERRPPRAAPDERRPPRAEPDERRPQKAEPDERKPPRAEPKAAPEGRPGRPTKPKPSPSPSPKKE